MRNLLAAEWQKIIGHRWLTGFTVWIFPVGALGVFTTLLFLIPEGKDRVLTGPVIWTDQFLGPWVMFGDPVGGMFVRTLPLVFCASVFAGEFSWGTWKNIVPRSNRTQLIFAKFVIIISMIFIALFATSLITGLMSFLIAAVAGQAVSPELTSEAISTFLGDYTIAVGLGLIVVIFIAVYGAVAAILTRSTIGGTIAGIGIMIAEEFLIAFLGLLARIFNSPDIVELYRFTPSYNLKNATYWVQVGEPANNQFFIQLSQPDTFLFSIIMLTLWCVGGMLFVAWMFNRQDITT